MSLGNKELDERALELAFKKSAHGVTRCLSVGSRNFAVENAGHGADATPLWAQWWGGFVRGRVGVPSRSLSRALRTVDLFASAGGLSVGAREAATALGMRFQSVAAVDLDADALAAF